MNFCQSLVHVLALTLIATLVPTVANASFNRIVEIRGEVMLKKKNGSRYSPASVGNLLKLGDLLLPKQGSVVKVRCADGKLKRARSGVESGLKTICPGVRYSTDSRGADIFLLLLTSGFVYETQFLEDKPLLRWPSVPEASRYRVRVMAADEEIWLEEIRGIQIPYGGTALQPEVDYQLVVEAVDGEETRQVYQLGFQRLNEAQTKAIETKVAQIQAEDVGEEAKALMLVDYYSEVGQENDPGLLMAAITTLETLVKQGNQTPVIRRMLGDLFVRTGMLRLAETRYQEALTLAKSSKNDEELAAIQDGLAHVYAAMGKLAESKMWLSQARETYMKAGTTERAELVQEWLDKLNLLMKNGNNSNPYGCAQNLLVP